MDVAMPLAENRDAAARLLGGEELRERAKS
jgi:hypothetical protein